MWSATYCGGRSATRRGPRRVVATVLSRAGLPIAAQTVWETTVGKTAGPSDARPTPYSLNLVEQEFSEVRIRHLGEVRT
jgi:hypothetical protein